MNILLLELDECVILVFVFQDQYGIYLIPKKKKEDYRRSSGEARNLGIHRHIMSS